MLDSTESDALGFATKFVNETKEKQLFIIYKKPYVSMVFYKKIWNQGFSPDDLIIQKKKKPYRVNNKAFTSNTKRSTDISLGL